jgi:uncharacterized membrane protein YqjE
MGHQETVNTFDGVPQSAPKGLAGDVREFAHDVLTLAELQAQLFVADVQECGQRVMIPGIVLICGVVLGMACFPLALVVLALFLVQIFEITSAMGFLIAFAAGAVLSALLVAIGYLQIREHAILLQRSREELRRNLNWIKKVLKRSRTTRSDPNDQSWRTLK